MTTTTGPFIIASTLPKKIKLFVWGTSGTGKTTLALQFPKPVVIDMEGGTDLYGGKTEFSVIKTPDLAAIRQALLWLKNEKHEYETLVIDPITVYWEECQRYWTDVFLSRCKGAKGHKNEFFDLGPKEWNQIKKSYKTFLMRLVDLPMNIVCCARAKMRYKDSGFMVPDGMSPDAEKSTEYMFDVVLQLTTTRNGGKISYESHVHKDRSDTLPATVQTGNVAQLLLAPKTKTAKEKN